MTPVIAVLLALAGYLLAYRFYARFLSTRIFRLEPEARTPAHTLRDDVDYVPTRPAVLFGHHFASITGLAPMLGPAVAVIWGWVPALLWVVLGAIFVGCVHDFAALVISIRNRGMSVGEVAGKVISKRARTAFHLIIFFGVALAMGVFVFVIARLFSVRLDKTHPGYPQAVLPSGLLMVVAMISGYLLYRRGFRLLPVASIGFLLLLFSIWFAKEHPTIGLAPDSWPAPSVWTWVLLAYGFAASVLPVWALLQARDFLNSLLLYLGLGLAYVGLFATNPAFDAPALNLHPADAPPMLPFVFIVIACGAASGFHALVSSGTTAKQLNQEGDARPIAYGAMIGESLLALLATIACTAGFTSQTLWHEHYASWVQAQGLTVKIDAFIRGTTSFLVTLGIPSGLASALIAMVVVSFALTTLDSATRLLRFNLEEIGASFKIPWSQNRYLSSLLACGAIGWFAFYEMRVGTAPDGSAIMRPAALALWTLFGTTNQVLAGLTLLLATLYLRARGWPCWPAAIPAVFMMGNTLVAMALNLRRFASQDSLLFAVGGILFLLAIWLVVEAGLVLARPRQAPPRDEKPPGPALS